MNDVTVRQLETEVEAARAQLANDLSTLRSPATLAEFAEGLKQEAFEAKDALIEKARSTAHSKVQEVVDDLKAKAAANPGAVLVLGAGVAWRLIQRPPIATALIGAGLFSLLRTAPIRTDGQEPVDYLAQAKERLREQASEVAGSIKEKTADAVSTMK